MTYVIIGSCVKDDACIEVCPVDCIVTGQAETTEQLQLKYQALMAEETVKSEG